MKIFLITFYCCLCLSTSAQPGDYSKFIDDRFLNTKQTLNTADGKHEIRYLGKIRDKNGEVLFYILSIFSRVQSAIVIHGNSRVIWLDKNKRTLKQFVLGIPDDLPFKLQKNNLYFDYIDTKTNKKEIFINSVGQRVPGLLCVAPNDCY